MRLRKTEREFRRADFLDLYGVSCSIQESSLATDFALWFGADKGTHHRGECMARMHLNQQLVRHLLPHLTRFAKTGRLA